MTSIAGQSLIRHIENGDLSTVVQYVNSPNISIDERDVDGQTFLMISSQLGHIDIVQELLRQPFIDVDSVDNDNWSALLNAAKEGYDQIVSLLLEAGANVDHKDIGGWTALMWSCYKGRTRCAQILLDSNANPNVKGEHHMSCVTWASGRGHEEIVRMLLAHGAKVNTADKYGTTPLIWASRKGFAGIVDMLLHAGANVDNAGMNSWTALLVAARGGYTDVVNLLLEHGPNVNAVDKDGFTALAWAAKDGYVEIVKSLLQGSAYVNLPDREGDTILIHAVKGGHLEVVKALIKKYADVDVQGVDDKTAVYWAVEKGHVNIVRALLDFSANIELQHKDGDTPLLKAVKNRQYEIVKILLEKHAKVSTPDKRGDTALHIAVRGRSKKIMELLLKNPKDGRLLYRPNKAGETPYQIDASKDKSILTQVFGTRNLNSTDNIRGYELYSSTIADVLSEPSLNTPINVGLYAKWGSGKSFLTDQLRKDMTTFSEQQKVPLFSFCILQGAISLVIALLCGVVLWLAVDWKVGLGVGPGVLLLQYALLGLMLLIIRKKDWDWCYYLSVRLEHKLQLLRLLLQVLFCNQPRPPKRETATVKFLFSNNARLASVVGEKSITSMISRLSSELEDEFGVLVTRLYSVFKPRKAEEHGRFKSICCFPYFIITILMLLLIATAAILLGYFGVHSITEPGYTAVDSVLIAIAIILLLALISNIYTWCKMLANIVIPPKRRINKIGARVSQIKHTPPPKWCILAVVSRRLDSIKSEGFVQTLKKEVELMSHMTNCMDAFLHTHTRLVVIVDGLDSCEQDKLLQVLDTLHMLFGDQGSPFITILAVDPHIIVKGIESNSQVFFRDTSINGHDYLRNMVQLPFFLQGQIQPAKRFISMSSRIDGMNETGADQGSTPGRVGEVRRGSRQRHDSNLASQLSLTEVGAQVGRNRRKSGYHEHSPMPPSNLLRQDTVQSDLSKSLGKNSYFSDINPRSMKRMMNIIAVTGRLLRALGIDFSWYKLAAWINLTEQWPYRLSWMILEQEDSDEEMNDLLTLKKLYDRIQEKLPANKDIEPLLEIDRNVRKLELFLTNLTPVLTVGDMRRFLPCTINVDPYLRKLIKELQQNLENMNSEYTMGMNALLSPKNSDLMQGYGTNIRSRHSSNETQNSRLTPTRSTSLGRAMAGSPFPNMVPNPFMQMMMSNPALMAQCMQMMGAAGGSQSPSVLMQQQQQQQQQTQDTSRLRKGLRVKMQPIQGVTQKEYDIFYNQLEGGLPPERLSNMSVESVCNLLHRLEGLSPQQLPQYQSRLQENNITGFVLMTCELPELKGVMQMSFGDWELFKTLIQMLRERDLAQKSATSSNDSLDESLPSPQKFTESVNVNQNEVTSPHVEIPKPVYKKSDSTSSRTSGGSAASNMTSYNSGAVSIDENTVSNKKTEEDIDREEFGKRRRMKRVDSMVVDVMEENNVLKGMIDSFGIQDVLTEEEDEDELEEHQKTITNPKDFVIAIENHVKSKNRKHVTGLDDSYSQTLANDTTQLVPKLTHKPSKKKKTKHESRRDSGKTTDTDSKRSASVNSSYSAYSAGPDESDTESEEEMEMLRRSRSRRISVNSKSSRCGVESGTSEPTSPVNKNKSKRTQNNRKSDLLSPTGEMLIPMEVASFSVGGQMGTSRLERQDVINYSNSHLSEQVLSPTSSYEMLALRKLTGMESDKTPSAFKTISQASSAQSSRASSRSGQRREVGGTSNSINTDPDDITTNQILPLSQSHSNRSMDVSEENLIGYNDNVNV